MSRVAVICYLWQPDAGSKFAYPYTAHDVRLLQRMVARHLTVPHLFVVITDQAECECFEGTEVLPVLIDKTTHVPGTCFMRLMTFHPEGRRLLGDKVLQIDLDTVIVGNIDHLVKRQEDLVLWRNPGRVPWDKPANPGRPYYNTSLLLHKCGTMPHLWSDFNARDPGGLRDDQWWLSSLLGPDVPYFDGERDGVYRIARDDTPGSGVTGPLPTNACVVT